MKRRDFSDNNFIFSKAVGKESNYLLLNEGHRTFEYLNNSQDEFIQN